MIAAAAAQLGNGLDGVGTSGQRARVSRRGKRACRVRETPRTLSCVPGGRLVRRAPAGDGVEQDRRVPVLPGVEQRLREWPSGVGLAGLLTSKARTPVLESVSQTTSRETATPHTLLVPESL